jgi:putative flavoprotein involved in K+ transport
MNTVDTVVIGAGHAGLATSRWLTRAGREHVVLDRGRVAERWRTERWDSLHLLSPNWMARLPGWCYTGPDPEGYMSRADFVDYLERYAASFDAPVLHGTAVDRVWAGRSGRYAVETSAGRWLAKNVVVATGPWALPVVPAGLTGAAMTAPAGRPAVGCRAGTGGLAVLAANDYRNPAQLPPGGVLVIGASSSGVQITDELARAGRRVVLAVGRHARAPRRYRGMDLYWWLERTGRTAQTIDQVADVGVARAEPSLQLVGRNEAPDADLDLATLQSAGVQLTGRFDGIDELGRARFRPDLQARVDDADRRMHRLLDSVDRHVAATGLATEVWPGVRPGPVRPAPQVTSLDPRAEGITSVVLAAGFRPDHRWLDVPVLDAHGQVRQARGVTAAPGLYVVGQRFQHRRDSGTIDGARHDALHVVRHLVARTTGGPLPAAVGGLGSARDRSGR